MTRKSIPVNGKRYVYLVCIENKNRNGCSNSKAISVKRLEEVILKIINLHIEEIFEMNKMLNIVKTAPYGQFRLDKINEGIKDKEIDIEKKEKYIKNAYADYVDEILTKQEYRELKDYFQKNIKDLRQEIQALVEEREKQKQNQSDKSKWIDEFLECRGFKTISRKLLLKLINEIRIYDRDRIEVVFKFQSEYEEMCKYLREINEWPEKVERR